MKVLTMARTFAPPLEERDLILVSPRHLMTVTTTRFVRFASAYHDGRRVIARRFAAEQTLIAARRSTTDDADGVQLVDHFGHRHELRHSAEWLAAKVGGGVRDDDADAARGERRREIHDARVQELRLIDHVDVDEPTDLLRDLRRLIHR